ncbi:MAG TPA: rod shape-determining protein MreC [Sphingomicrobium sp.]|nr:rod shape-determining protein MreC [Sphingomicrobium sp.]
MATARPGWSRRAQYGLFFSFLALIAGILIGLLLLALSIFAPARFDSVRGAALDVTGPVASGLHEITSTVEGLFTGAGNYWDAAGQNGKLKRERDAMARQILTANAVLQENRQLKALLKLRERERGAVAVGRLVGSSFSSPRRFAILSAGSSDGVRIGMPVRSPDGLVGRVIDAGALASRVLLVSDRNNIVPARVLRGGLPVIAQGRGDGTIDVRPLEVGRNPFKRGDIIITSGTGGLYPPLVPVARVVKLDDDGAVALPLADPANVSFAVVEPPYEPDAAASDSPAPSERP